MRSDPNLNSVKTALSSVLRNLFVKKIPLLIFSSAAFLGGSMAHADFDLTMTHSYNGGLVYDLSWDAVTPSTDSATVTYYVFQEFGRDGVYGPDFIIDFSSAIFRTDKTSVDLSLFANGGYGVGSRCFAVISSDSFTGDLNVSDQECHGFIHNLTKEGILRADGDGTMRGVDQKWTFTYSLDADAYVTARIYPPGTLFTEDTNGFIISASSPVVKTLVENTPRSFEMLNHDITMEETWDSRSSTGVIVPNGIYYLVLSATLDRGFFSGGVGPDESEEIQIPETLLRDAIKFSIPVDIIRIMNLAATGITQSNATSKITYDLTGDANVRVLIARPGASFTVDSNGDIQAVDRSTGLIDPDMVVSSFTFQRKAGSNIEAWDGTSSTGAVMASGVYPVGISASDEYGNHAIDATGNDFPIFTTITLERSAGSDSGTDTDTDTTPPSIAAITPVDGTSTNNEVDSVVVQLSDTESAINLSGSAITVRDPNNAAVPGTTTNNGTDTLTFTPTTAMRESGTYTISIIALDNAGQSATYTKTFTVNIRLDSNDLKSSMSLFPNPAKNTPATIQYALSVDATTNIEIFNVLGEKVYSATYSDAQNSTIAHTWDGKSSSGKKVGSGLYLVRIKSEAPGSKAEAIKKLVFIQ